MFIMRLIVVFIAVASDSPALSIRQSVLTPLPRLHLVLVHAVAALLPVSSSTYQPKPPALLVVCFVLAIVVLIVVLMLCWHRGLRCLNCAPSSSGKAWSLGLKL